MLELPLPFAVLAVCLIVAAAIDIGVRRIPNGVVVAGLCAALMAAHREGGGAAGLLPALTGAVAMLGVSIPLYALRVIGAGDAKLMSVVGAALGTSAAMQVGAIAIVCAAVAGVVGVVATGRWALFAANLRLGTTALADGDVHGVREVARSTAYRMPFAVAVAVSFGLWLGFVR